MSETLSSGGLVTAISFVRSPCAVLALEADEAPDWAPKSDMMVSLLT